MENNIVKVLLKSVCPHCQKEVLVEVESPTPLVKGILMASDIAAAKEYVVNKLKALYKAEEIGKDDLDNAISWIENEETVFGPDDVEIVINSVKFSKPDGNA